MYKRQVCDVTGREGFARERHAMNRGLITDPAREIFGVRPCLLYTSDAADERSSVDLGGRRIIKKKKRGTNRSGDR